MRVSRRLALYIRSYSAHLREFVVSVGHELFVRGEGRDHIPQRGQGFVDALGLFQPLRRRPRLVGPLRPREIHQRQLPGGCLLGRLVVHLIGSESRRTSNGCDSLVHAKQ